MHLAGNRWTGMKTKQPHVIARKGSTLQLTGDKQGSDPDSGKWIQHDNTSKVIRK